MPNDMFTQLPTVVSSQFSDIICAVQGGVSVQETLQQVFDLMSANTVLSNAGNPNGTLAGQVYQLCWDTTNSNLYICTTTGSSSTAVWTLVFAVPVSVPKGGTGNTTFTAYSLLCGGTTSTGSFQNVSGLGSVNQVLTSNGASTLPTWQNSSGSGTVNSGTANQLAYYNTTGTAVSGLTDVNNGILATNSTGVPTWVGSLTNGQILIGSTGATPTAATLTAGSGISIGNAAGSITISSSGGSVTPAAIQNNQYIYAVDSSFSNPYIVTLTPTLTSLTDGTIIIMSTTRSNSTSPAPQITVGSLGTFSILSPFSTPLFNNDIPTSNDAILLYSSAQNSFLLLNPEFSTVSSQNLINNYYLGATDTGSSNLYALSLPILQSSFGGQFSVVYLFNTGNSNTGSSTITITWVDATTSTYNIVNQDGSNLNFNQMISGNSYILMLNNVNNFVLVNPNLSATAPSIFTIPQVDGVVGGDVPFQTLPSNGLNYYPDTLKVAATNVVGFTSAASISVGTNSPVFNNILTTTALTTLNATGTFITIPLSTSAQTAVPPGTQIVVQVVVNAVATTLTYAFQLFGTSF